MTEINSKTMKTFLARYLLIFFCLSSVLTPQLTSAQKSTAAKPFELTVDSIMRGPRLVGYPPTGVYWSQDSQRVYFRWKEAGEPRLKETSLYVVNRDGSACVTVGKGTETGAASGRRVVEGQNDDRLYRRR